MLSKLKSVDKNLSPGLRKIIRNIGWLSAERILSMILSFFMGVYVIRYLGPDNFGKLSYSISFVGLFIAISKLGLDKVVVRNLVQYENLTFDILGTAFFLKFIGSLAATILISLTIWNFTNDIQICKITIVIAFGLIFSSFDVIDLWFQSQILSKSITILRSGQLITISLAKIFLISYQMPLIVFAYLLLVDSIIKALGMIVVYYKSNQSILKWRIKKSAAINLLKDSWLLILSGVMVTIYLKIDQVMLGNISSSQDVGNYAAAVRFSEVWYFVPMIICSSVFPPIIKAKQRSEEEYYRKLQQLYDLMAWISLAIAIPMTFVSSFLITTLLGQEYFRSGQILGIHIWAGVFVFLGVARSQWLMAENFLKISFLTTSLGAASNLVLNYLLIPYYGGVGAAFATVISYAIHSYLSCMFFPSMFRTGSQITKALLIPFRINQNLIYFNNLKRLIFSSKRMSEK